ncbi:MAG: S8 family serine peptidase [Bacteroidetes bacterium]|nr:S8 family serine peptidase [Bacteroidota bacterium]
MIKISSTLEATFLSAKQIPYWKDLISDRSLAVESFFPAFDDFFRNNHIAFWITKEYRRQHLNWGPEEIETGLNRIYRVILQNDYELPVNFLNQVKTLPDVEEATELTVAEAEIPTQIATQASFERQKTAEQIYLPYAQLLTKGSPSIKIAVLDTGVNLNHRELEGKIVKPMDFVNLEGLDTAQFIGDLIDADDIPEDEVGHGTHVSGIIAAQGIEMDEGVCPGCKVMPVRVLATMKTGNKVVGAGIIDNINSGIKYAVDNGADIINMSLGIKHEGGGLPHEDVINYALSKNVTIVAASGNDGTSEKYYPGALPGVIAVGAVDDSGTVTNFTSYGANITVVAPGLNIYSSYTRNTYAFASGTSQAAPFVCGTIGLLKSYAKQKGRTLNNDAIIYILKQTSDKADKQLRNEKAGYGMINLADAFKLLNYIIN